MTVNRSMLCQFQKIFSWWPERENTKIYFYPSSHSLSNSGPMKGSHSPTIILFCSQGTAKNVIESSSVFCHAAWTVGSLAFSTESSIVFSCYWTRVKSGTACSFLPPDNVCLFTRPDRRPSLTLLPASSSYWAPCKEQLFQGGLPCSILIFKASVEAWAFSGWTGKDLDWA